MRTCPKHVAAYLRCRLVMKHLTNAPAVEKYHVQKVKVLVAKILNVKEGLYANPTVELMQIKRMRVAVALLKEVT